MRRRSGMSYRPRRRASGSRPSGTCVQLPNSQGLSQTGASSPPRAAPTQARTPQVRPRVPLSDLSCRCLLPSPVQPHIRKAIRSRRTRTSPRPREPSLLVVSPPAQLKMSTGLEEVNSAGQLALCSTDQKRTAGFASAPGGRAEGGAALIILWLIPAELDGLVVTDAVLRVNDRRRRARGIP